MEFKGFRQVTQRFFDSLTDEEKIGYIWFVRSNIEGSGSTQTYDGDIFLGTRCYGHFGGEVVALEIRINRILRQAGIIDDSGNTIVLSTVYLSKQEAEDLYVKKVTLFNTDISTGEELGLLVIDGDDVTNN